MSKKAGNIIKTDAASPKAIITDADYRTWIRDIASRYRQSQIRAAVRVNSEMLHYYWQLGADIHNRQFENRYGSRFYANASRDLRAELVSTRDFQQQHSNTPSTSTNSMHPSSQIVSNLLMISTCCFRYLGRITSTSSTKSRAWFDKLTNR